MVGEKIELRELLPKPSMVITKCGAFDIINRGKLCYKLW